MAKKTELQAEIDKADRRIMRHLPEQEIIDMAKEMLRAVTTGRNTHRYTLNQLPQVIAAEQYLTRNHYWNLVGGTPKSGARYAPTDKGIKWSQGRSYE